MARCREVYDGRPTSCDYEAGRGEATVVACERYLDSPTAEVFCRPLQNTSWCRIVYSLAKYTLQVARVEPFGGLQVLVQSWD